MANKIQDQLRISGAQSGEINALLLDPESRVVRDVLDVVADSAFRGYGSQARVKASATFASVMCSSQV